MPIFSHSAEHNATQKEIWDWYNSPGAFRRIMPEWEGIQPINAGALKDGEETIFKVGIGPVKLKWIARHHSVIEGKSFADDMIKGPFGKWSHQHTFEATSDDITTVRDKVDYKLPFHIFTGWSKGFTVLPRMKQMFHYRSTRVSKDLERIQATSSKSRQKVLVSGSTGMIGLQLCAFLEAAGHDVYRLMRPTSKLPPDVNPEKIVRWNDLTGDIISGSFEGFDCVIHLAGAGIGDKRWSKKRKQLIRDSRVIPTQNLSKILSGLSQPPKKFLCASAVGFYGNRGTEVLDEKSTKGDDYLASICSEWEDSTVLASDSGINVIHMRTGIVVSPFLANKFGKKNGALVLFAVSLTVENGIIVLRLLGLLPENGSPIVLAGVLVFHFIGVATSVISFTTLNSMVWDTVEEVEIKTGRRMEGTLL
ncbi:MAG: hypothetical protein CL996_03250, partial [Euryarchaeota archaeon]|nr:hypothetical protein [Euryarchaeota archaeon]